MKKLTIKFLFLSFILFPYCSKDHFSTVQSNNSIKNESIDNSLIFEQVYNRINEHLKRQDKVPVDLNVFFPNNQISKAEKEKIVRQIKFHSQLYKDYGVDGLLEQLNLNPKVSKKVVAYFDELQGMMRVKKERNETSYEAIDTTLKKIENRIKTDKTLELKDAEVLLNSFQVTRGAYKYYIEQEANALKSNKLQTRCRKLVIWGVAVGAGIVTASLILDGVIKVAAGTGQWYIAGAAAIALGLGYLLCEVLCVFGGCEEIECELITGSMAFVSPKTCNSTDVVLYGQKDIVKWRWDVLNANGLFDNTETTVPYNTFRAGSSPNLNSDIRVTTVCVDEEQIITSQIFKFSDLVSSAGFISIVDWPLTITKFQPMRFYASRGTNDNFVLSWTVSPSAVGISSSGYQADITFFSSGIFTVKAKLTNTCTGQFSENTRQVIVN